MTTAVEPLPTDMPWDVIRVCGQAGLPRRNSLDSSVTVLRDGRLDIDLSHPGLAGWLARLKPSPPSPSRADLAETAASRYTGPKKEDAFPLRLNIVIQIVGSRGDIQPFIALGQSLKQYGHRVRLATHLTFRNSVNETGLEFFDIGGNPAEMMAYMVNNTGLLPEFKAIRSGAIKRHRRDMGNIIHGCWRSCYETGDGTQLHRITDELVHGAVGCRPRPFVADVIIANPPSFAHIHCAEKLGVPLTIMFTMPWSPTQAFPHPLANIRRYNTKPTVANAASYALVDMLHWQGLGDVINRFRRKTLKLDILDPWQAQGIVHRLNIPHAYLWSPALLSKPADWSDNIDVCGFSFLSSASDYTPPDDLLAFLQAGQPPIYIGFGSIIVDDPQALIKTIRAATQKAGQRAIISKGWGGLGAVESDIQEGIFLLGDCPHDWLFQHVSCVVHHGGAGTVATGLKARCPTVVVPFFGDQPFWGAIIARDGVGPSPIPYKELTVDKLTDAILEALNPSPRQKAREISEILQGESGIENAISSFHRHLHYERMRCALCPSRPAVWWARGPRLALSAFATTVLVEAGLLDPCDIKLYRAEDYDTSRDPPNPFNAGLQILFGSVTKGVIDMGDGASEILNAISPRRFYEKLHARNQERAYGWVKRHELTSIENQATINAGTPVVLSDDWDTVRRRSSSRKRHVATLGNFLTTTAAHASRLAQGTLDIIIIPPMEISLTLSKSFRNAPLVFHDDTVRTSPRVIGVRSGLRAAGNEFIFGIYDGFSGLTTQPGRGLRNAGGKGLIGGVEKGVAGVIFKPLAGLFGLAAYPLAGLHKHLRDSLSERTQRPIRRSRIAQGIEDFQASSIDEQAEVIRQWRARVDLTGAKRKRGLTSLIP